jgi:hypothetical protein
VKCTPWGKFDELMIFKWVFDKCCKRDAALGGFIVYVYGLWVLVGRNADTECWLDASYISKI